MAALQWSIPLLTPLGAESFQHPNEIRASARRMVWRWRWYDCSPLPAQPTVLIRFLLPAPTASPLRDSKPTLDPALRRSLGHLRCCLAAFLPASRPPTLRRSFGVRPNLSKIRIRLPDHSPALPESVRACELAPALPSVSVRRVLYEPSRCRLRSPVSRISLEHPVARAFLKPRSPAASSKLRSPEVP